jgi:polysaccharide deacetylase 2 family uncharacterized protein YibQ
MPKGRSKKKKKTARASGPQVVKFWLISVALVVVVALAVWELVSSGKAAALAERVFGTRDLTPKAEQVDRALDAAFVKLGIERVTSEEEPRESGRYVWLHREKRGQIPHDVGLVETNLTITRAVRDVGGRVVGVHERGARPGALATLDMRLGVGSIETHHVVLKETKAPEGAEQGLRVVVDTEEDRPRIAIVIDDFGYNHSETTQGFIDLGQPITMSVLPYTPRTDEIAEAAHRAGKEVLAHIPMQPEDWPNIDPGDGVLLLSHSEADVRRLTSAAIDAVPHAVGANNHMGSAFTKDRTRMRAVLEAVGAKGLFFVDSMTTPQSVGLSEASRAGVRATRNHMFIDSRIDEHGQLDVVAELEELAELARRRGAAVGIGHPRKETLGALQRVLPRLEAQGIDLVFVSELAK